MDQAIANGLEANQECDEWDVCGSDEDPESFGYEGGGDGLALWNDPDIYGTFGAY